MKRCTNCGIAKANDNFYVRDDAPGLYAWCTDCMKEQGRTTDYPPIKERGHGLLDGGFRVINGSL